MKECCDDKREILLRLRHRQRRVLVVVLWLNAAMFVVELVAGISGHSTALLGDSLDMLGDAAVYALSLLVLDRGQAWRARASMVKGMMMVALGVAVLAEAVVKVAFNRMPEAEAMGGIGLLALAVNVACLFLLLRHREDDINMRSAWVCSRNDIVANVAVISAAAIVWATHSWLPDVLVGGAIAILFLVSGAGVFREGRRTLEGDPRGRDAVERRSTPI